MRERERENEEYRFIQPGLSHPRNMPGKAAPTTRLPPDVWKNLHRFKMCYCVFIRAQHFLKPTGLAERAHCNLMQFVSALKNNSVRHQGKWCTIQQQSSVICRLCDWKWGGEQFPKECILLSRCIRIKGKMVARETGHSCQLCRRRIVKCLQGALYSHKRRQEHSQARDPDVALGTGHPFQGLASAFRQTERVWHICSLQKGNTHEKQRKGCHKIMIWHCTWQRH